MALFRLLVLAFSLQFFPWTLLNRIEAQTSSMETTLKSQLDQAILQLNQTRRQISDEKIPLAQGLNVLETEVVQLRQEAARLGRLADDQSTDLNELRKEVKAREEEFAYTTSLLEEYTRYFESRLHIAELQLFRDSVRETLDAGQDPTLSPGEQLTLQLNFLESSIKRLDRQLGGEIFNGKSIAPSGTLESGQIAILGPVAFFAGQKPEHTGPLHQESGLLEAKVHPLPNFSAEDIQNLFSQSQGTIPLDATLGDAIRLEANRESFLQHLKNGGPIMVPILLLGGVALILWLLKWKEIRHYTPLPDNHLQAILQNLHSNTPEKALQTLQTINSPVGNMLRSAVNHHQDSKELLEEILYEHLLTTKAKVESKLPFLALTAATAPLLGLLGTVTGMINTFEMITVFGTGNAKRLSSGISEALITTEFGLIIAVLALLGHAFLSRRTRHFLTHMEGTAVAFVNGCPKQNPPTP